MRVNLDSFRGFVTSRSATRLMEYLGCHSETVKSNYATRRIFGFESLTSLLNYSAITVEYSTDVHSVILSHTRLNLEIKHFVIYRYRTEAFTWFPFDDDDEGKAFADKSFCSKSRMRLPMLVSIEKLDGNPELISRFNVSRPTTAQTSDIWRL